MNKTSHQQSGHTKLVVDIVEELKLEQGALLPILHGIQDELGYVPTESVPFIADSLNLSRAEVHGVISFYHYFRSSPPGRYTVQICRAESCQAMGSRVMENHAKELLGIDFHETTADGEVTLLPVYCLGNCACSPSVRVGNEIFSHVDKIRFDAIVASLGHQPVEVT